MKIILFLFFCLIELFAARIEYKVWPKGETLLSFFEKNGISGKLYYNLAPEEKELADEIRANSGYYELRDENNRILQLLIPISSELQIHVFKDRGYRLEFTPIHYRVKKESFCIELFSSPYNDIVHYTKNHRLAKEFVQAFKNSLDFSRSIRKGDRLALLYSQKFRLGMLFEDPTILAAMVEMRGKAHYIFNFKGRYYDENGKEMESFLLKKPIRHARITSRFTLRRWHPILHKYRAHLGVDFGARRGIPVMAAGSGKVIFAGRKGGYGNVVIISHGQGYKTLYAHLSKFRRGIRYGKRVRQGQVIGYVGSTGLSTGPHLHFGLYKNGRAINPLSVVRISKSRLTGRKLKEFQKVKERYKELLLEAVKEKKSPEMIEVIKSLKEEIKGGKNGKS